MDSLHIFTIPKWFPNNIPPELCAIIFCWKQGISIFAKLGFPNPTMLPRHHPVLVKVVEVFGNEIADPEMNTNLYIHTFKGCEYRIEEYDGAESVLVPGDFTYTKVTSNEVNLTKEHSDIISHISNNHTIWSWTSARTKVNTSGYVE